MASDACHCKEFSRAGLLRQTAAEAGRGLPSIEPGMPLPAGTGLDRRAFLSRTAGLALAVYGANGLRPEALEDGLAEAAAAAPNGRILVSVFLEGGADVLSLLAPAENGRYRQLRSRLALPPSAGKPHASDPRYRWHPAVEALATLDREGKLGILPGIGYLSPDQSHFTSRHYWEVGATDAGIGTGWLGRYLDRNGSANNPVQGLSLDFQLQPALAPSRAPVASLSLPESFRLQVPGAHGEVGAHALNALGALETAHRRSKGALREAARTGARAAELHRQLQPAGATGTTKPDSPVPYPDSTHPFPQRLAALASLLGAGMPVTCATLKAMGNYDTHGNQEQMIAEALTVTSDSLLAFQRDLEARGLADRVLVHVWSEFGRRAADNASQGTDHGAAGVGFLIGSRAKRGLLSEYPSLDRLDEQGNLRPTIDFRSVYRSLLEQWLGVDAAGVIPKARAFAQPNLVT